MRILLITPFISKHPLRGYEKIAYYFFEELNKKGFTVDILTHKYDRTRIFKNNHFQKKKKFD